MYGRYQSWEGVFEVRVVSEHMAWKQRRDGGALLGCVEDQNEHTYVSRVVHIWLFAHKKWMCAQ